MGGETKGWTGMEGKKLTLEREGGDKERWKKREEEKRERGMERERE